MKERNNYWDALKGISIIAVIIIHASGSAFTFDKYSANHLFGVIERQFVNFGVPMFFAISGYFCGGVILKSKQDILKFYNKKFVRLAVPYLSWSIVAIFIYKYDQISSLGSVLLFMFLGQSCAPYYFVVVLLQFILLTPLLLKLSSLKLLVSGIGLSLISLSLVYYFRASYPDHLISNSTLFGTPFPVWSVFYFGGIVFKRNASAIIVFLQKRLVLLVTLVLGFLLISLTEAIFWYEQGFFSIAASQVKLSSYILSALLIVFAFVMSDDESTKRYFVLSYIGRLSFGIYFSHMFFLTFLGAFDFVLAPFRDFQPLSILVASFLTLTLSVVAIECAKRVLGEKIARKFLGL